MGVLSVSGLSNDGLVALNDGSKPHLLLPELVPSWLALKSTAQQAGFDIIIVSAFRSFERQLAIWNAKALGQRRVIDDAGSTVNMAALSELDKIHAIMRFSALPGASRHHWGSDIDIFDTSRLGDGYQCQLTLAETYGDGPCADFYTWLADYEQQPSFEFKRPYEVDTGGVAEEPWHLSHIRAASRYESLLSPVSLKAAISEQPLALKQTVLSNFEALYERYIEVKTL